jgi:hypothetical protein
MRVIHTARVKTSLELTNKETIAMNFDDDLLRAIGAWQKGWREDQVMREEFAKELRAAATLLPQTFRTANGQACYRKRFLHKGELERIIMADWRDEGVVSWTLDRAVADKFRGKFKPGAVTGAIFRRTPLDDEVIVNIPALWESPEFVQSVESYRDRGREHSDALFHFRGLHNQSEIVLTAPLRASEFDDLCDMLSLPQEGRDELFRELNNSGIALNEPRYVNEEQTQRIIGRTQDRIHALIAQTIAKQTP